MKIESHPDAHFTYCSNIHPGEEWDDHFSELKKHLPVLKQKLSPDKDFGVGLRLSAIAAKQLKQGSALSHFSEWLKSEGLYVFTINGFPYGSFHGERVKDNVYSPDWTTSERLDYTLQLSDILSALLPDGIEGGISTSPVSYKYWRNEDREYGDIFDISTKNMARAAYHLHQHYEATGKIIHLDIEPEPDCLLETGEETRQFFTTWLFPKGSEFLNHEFGIHHDAALKILKTHIRVCYDTCHFALEYENASQAITAFVDDDISIGKTQVSSALKINWVDQKLSSDDVLKKLSSFDEPVYLHQVLEKKKDGSLKQYRDLTDAIEAFDQHSVSQWRIHFHVPLFLDQFGYLRSTRDHISKALPVLFEKTDCRHFEIETYTWDVLPEEYKLGVTDSIEREYRWLIDQMNHK